MLPPFVVVVFIVATYASSLQQSSRLKNCRATCPRRGWEGQRSREKERERTGRIPYFVCKACNILWAATEVFGRELKSKINWYILKLRRTGRNGIFTFWPMRQFYTVHWHLNRTKQEQEEHKLMTTRANESRIKITQKWRPRSEIPLLFIVSMP